MYNFLNVTCEEDCIMAYNTIIFDRYGTENRLGRITLNRPEKLNTLSAELLGEFESCLREVSKDPDVRVLIIRGAGRAFGAGYDLTPATTSYGTPAHARQPYQHMRWDHQDGLRL